MKKLQCLLAIFLVCSCVLPVSADSAVGGIVFIDFYQFQKNLENTGTEDQTLSRLEVPSSTRLRIRWTNEDKVTMYAEMGLGGSDGGTSTKLRHAWGSWDFNETWQLMAGHSSTPYSPIFPSQLIGNSSGEDHVIGHGYGDHNPGRVPQIRLTYKFLNKRGALAFALVQPHGGDKLAIDGQEIGVRNTSAPRLDVGAAISGYNFQFFPSFFYQTQEYTEVAIPGVNDVTSWGTSLGFKSGRGRFLLSGEANIGSNWGNTSGSLGTSPAANYAGARLQQITGSNGDVLHMEDTDNMAYWLDLGMKFTTRSTRGTVHLIYGNMASDTDGFGDLGATDMESNMIGVSVPIDLPWVARGFRVRPEIFRYDEGDNTLDGVARDFGQETIAGVQLQYTF